MISTLFGEEKEKVEVQETVKVEKAKPWDYTNAIYQHKHLINESADVEVAEKEYNAYFTNQHFSFFVGTIFYANEMNRNYNLSKKMQYDYYFNSIRKQRPNFVKLPKREQPESIDLVKEFYKYNDKRAQEALSLLSDEQLVFIEKKLAKGGIRNGR